MQERSPHSFLGDMEAEGALYSQAPKLVEFLAAWSHSAAATRWDSAHASTDDKNAFNARYSGGGGRSGGGGGSRRVLGRKWSGRTLVSHEPAPVGSESKDERERTSAGEVSDFLPARMQLLYADLYERGYIELDDVLAAQMWLQALANSGFDFPRVV